MNFIAWLIGHAPAVDNPPPLPAANILPLPEEPDWADDPDEFLADIDGGMPDWEDDLDAYLSELHGGQSAADRARPRRKPHVQAADRIDLEPIYTMIDYVDSTGQRSRRRITLLSLKRGPNAPLLTAICHERRATRTFRCDRIGGFIDGDSVVEDAKAFFRETMLVDLDTLAPDEALATARLVRDQLRPGLSVLVALARSDDEFHAEELDRILQYTERELPHIEGGDAVGLDELDAMIPLVENMRPTREALPGYLARIEEFSAPRRANFSRSVFEVVVADRRFAMEEEDFLRDLPPWMASELR